MQKCGYKILSMRRWKGGGIGAAEASLKRRMPSQAENRMSCSVSASVPGGRRYGQAARASRSGVVPEFPSSLGQERGDRGVHRWRGRKASGIPRYRPVRAAVLDRSRLWFASQSSVGQRSRRHLGADISGPTRSTADWVWGLAGEERGAGSLKALGKAWQTEGCSRHRGATSYRLLGATRRIATEGARKVTLREEFLRFSAARSRTRGQGWALVAAGALPATLKLQRYGERGRRISVPRRDPAMQEDSVVMRIVGCSSGSSLHRSSWRPDESRDRRLRGVDSGGGAAHGINANVD